MDWTRVLVAHACNCSCSGGRDQEDCSLKPAGANSSGEPNLKKPITKKGWWSGSRCRPWIQRPIPKKKGKIESLNLTKINLLLFEKPQRKL
jgi:hypothetical protein